MSVHFVLWKQKFQRKVASAIGALLFHVFLSTQFKDAVGKKEIVENDPKDFYVCLNILHIGGGGNNLVFFSVAKKCYPKSMSQFFYKDNSKNSGLKFYMFSLVGKT